MEMHSQRNLLYNLIKKAKAIQPARPIVVNEDSQALSQMKVTFQNGVSWGYYNNMTKQEPPTVWGITKGEDAYFALRMQEYLTGKQSDLPFEDQFYLQGLEKDMAYEGKRFIRLASLAIRSRSIMWNSIETVFCMSRHMTIRLSSTL